MGLHVAKIGAGIDFEQFYTESFEVDIESGTVFVEMPRAQITYVAIDNAQTQVIDRDTGLFTKGDPKLESDARQVAEQVLRDAAIEAGILDRAQKNARTIIEGLLLELGYTRVVFGRDQTLPGSTSRDRDAFDDDHSRMAAISVTNLLRGNGEAFPRSFVASGNRRAPLDERARRCVD